MKKPFSRSPIWITCVPLALLLALSGCGKPDAAKPGERRVLFYQSAMHPWVKSDQPGRCTICGMELTPIYEGEAGLEAGGDVLALSSDSIHVLNVQTSEARAQPLTRTLRFAGTIENDDSRRRILSATVAGRIEQLHVGYVGAEVRAGEPLADFFSPVLLTAARDYLLVQRSGGEPALVQAAASRLRQLGLGEAQIAGLPETFNETGFVLPLLAPASGTVVGRGVYAGQYVQEGGMLFELADFSTMWFQFLAYEPDLPWLRPGLQVEVRTPSRPGETFTGQISFIDPNFDPATRSTRVRVELENPVEDGRRRFQHRVFAEAEVRLDAPVVLAVPRSAVIQSGPEAAAFVDQGGGAFERRALQLGRRGDDLVEVRAGLTGGEKVVVQGNLLMDGQAQMNRVFARAAPPEPGEASIAPPPLTAPQREALNRFFTLADTLAGALAADNLAAYNQHAPGAESAARAVRMTFPAGAWHALAHPLAGIRPPSAAVALEDARKDFQPFSDAAVALAQAARRADSSFAGLKVFRCPMTGDVFPGAPRRLDWLQLRGPLRNPWHGAEMLECGVEVQP